MLARLLRLIAVLLAGLLLGVGAFVALIALGMVPNPLDPVIGGDLALARSTRPACASCSSATASPTTTTCRRWWGALQPPIRGQSR